MDYGVFILKLLSGTCLEYSDSKLVSTCCLVWEQGTDVCKRLENLCLKLIRWPVCLVVPAMHSPGEFAWVHVHNHLADEVHLTTVCKTHSRKVDFVS